MLAFNAKKACRRAALRVYVMWSWLEQHPEARKENYPLFFELRFYRDYAACPWCTLWLRTACELDDTICPLNAIGEACPRDDSIYAIWQDTTSMTLRSRMAGEIAKIAWAEYKRLGG